MRILVYSIGVVAVSVLAVACSSYCSSAANLGQTLAQKLGTCDAGVSINIGTCKNTTACQNAYGACSSADQSKLNNELNCFENVPNCVPGQEGAWLQSLGSATACYLDAGAISAGCAEAFIAAYADAGGC